ncbi:MAG: choice-of-anchor L domain-containing protein [Crocinitomicaceae bacterium]
MKRITLFIFGAILSVSSYVNAQFTVTNTQTVEDLITNVLAPGVQITNVTVNGGPGNVTNVQVGYFDDMGTGFPISTGIVMSTGNAVDCAPAGTFSSTDLNGGADPDLLQINGGTSINDAIVIEFDFLATNDTAVFNYSFGSEEYNTYVSYADVFGFFLSGPGIAGPFSNSAVNIAIVPGTATEVSIATINNGSSNSGPCVNCQYYNYNTGSPMAFQGYTDVLTAIAAPLVCGETYHIKMALGDNLDGIYDTGVFLESESFVATGPNVSLSPINPDGSISTDSVVVEGCTEALLVFTRDDATGAICYPLSVGGTATPGVDYNVLPDSVCMPDGVDSVTVSIIPIQDGMSESPESITLGTYIISACGDTIPLNGTIWIIDAPTFNVVVSDTTLTCPPGNINITASTDAGTPPFTYDWGAQGTGATVSVPPTTGTTPYTVDVTDGCGVTAQGTMNVTVNSPAPPTITFSGGSTQTICPGQNITITPNVTGNTGTPSFEWSFNNGISPVESTNSTWTIAPTTATWAYVQVTDNCNSVLDSMRILMGSVNVTAINITDITSCVGVNDNGEIEIITNPAAGVGNFTFDIDGGIPNTTASNSSGLFAGLYNGAYQIHVEDVNTGCTLDTVVSIGAITGTPPTANPINVVDVTCPGAMNGSIELQNITGTSGNLPFDITWTPTAGPVISETGIITTSPTATHTQSNLYGSTWTITISDQIGCASSYTVTINEPSPITLGLTYDEPLCYGQSYGSVYINGGGGTTPYTFTIYDADSNLLNTGNSNAAELIPTGWYYTAITDARGCFKGDSIFLDQPDSMYASILLTNPKCYAEASGEALVDQVFNAQGAVQYSWSPSQDSTNYARFLNAGNHTVTLVDSVGCIWQYSFTLTNPDSIYIQTISSEPSYCRGDNIYPGSGTVSGTAAGGTGTITYTWTGNGQTVNTNTWGNRKPGWYFLYASDQNNCIVSDSVYVDSLNPVANFTADPMQGTEPVTVTIEDMSSDRVTNTWGFIALDANGDTISSSGNSYVIGYDSLQPPFDTTFMSGDYEICLVVSNNYECYDTLCKSIEIFPIPSITDPNVITPNGDNNNDTWAPITQGMAELNCTILNRWGNKVFELTSPSDTWDGTNMNTGQRVADGVYSFVYTARAQNGTEFTGQGFIHVISK